MTDHVRYAVADHIATITLARPPLNAFSIAFLDQIIAARWQAASPEAIAKATAAIWRDEP